MDSYEIGFKNFFFHFRHLELYTFKLDYTGLVLIIYIAKFIFLVDYWIIIKLDINFFVEMV